jgi:hypothetical protein
MSRSDKRRFQCPPVEAESRQIYFDKLPEAIRSATQTRCLEHAGKAEQSLRK